MFKKKSYLAAALFMLLGVLGLATIPQTVVQAQDADRGTMEAVSNVVSDKAGWPFTIEGDNNYISERTTGDINGDGILEVIVYAITITEVSNQYDCTYEYTYTLHVLNADGTAMTGWPQTLSFHPYEDIMVGDINNDGKDEIAIADDDFSGTSNLHMLTEDGSELSGWPVALVGWPYEKIFSDMNNDGKMDIVVSTNSGIYIYEDTGTVMTGWPMSTYSPTTLSVVDVEGDGVKELAFANPSTNELIVTNVDGTVKTGWPVTVANIRGDNIVSADFDNDGKDEIACSSRVSSDSHSPAYSDIYLYLIDDTGTAMTGWPYMLEHGWGTLIAGDIDGDGSGELVLPASDENGYVYTYAWNSDGTVPTGFPIQTISAWGNTYLVDLNYDGAQEIIRSFSYNFFVYDLNGQALADYSFMVSPRSTLDDVIITDLENDGFIDVLGFNDSNTLEIYSYNTGVAGFYAHWPESYSNRYHTRNVDLSIMYEPGEEADATTEETPVEDVDTEDTEEGTFAVYNGNKEVLYTCEVFNKGTVDAVMETYNDRYYVFATTVEAGKELKVVNPLNCETLQTVTLSKKAQLNQFAVADIYKKTTDKEIITASPRGTDVKTAVYFMADGTLVKKASKVSSLGISDWNLGIKKTKIQYKSGKTVLKQLKFVKKKKYSLREL